MFEPYPEIKLSDLLDYPFTFIGMILGLLLPGLADKRGAEIDHGFLPGKELIICIAVGFCFDKTVKYFAEQSKRKAEDHSQGEESAEENLSERMFDSRRTYIEILFSLFAKLAYSDGYVSTAEIEVVEKIIKETFHLDRVSSQLAINTFRNANRNSETFLGELERFRQNFGHDRLLVERLFEMLIRLAEADGEMNQKEEEMIRDAARSLGCELDDFARVKNTPSLLLIHLAISIQKKRNAMFFWDVHRNQAMRKFAAHFVA